MTRASFRLRFTRREAVFWAITSVILSGVGFALLAALPPGIPRLIAATVSSVLLTLGLGGFVYDVSLRESVARETTELLELKQSIVGTGLIDVNKDASLDWRGILGQATEVTAVVAMPFGWLEQSWPHILEAASARKVTVTILLPDPECEIMDGLAFRLNKSPEVLKEQINDFGGYLQTSWENAQTSHSPLRKGGRLTIKHYAFFPPFDVIATNLQIVVRVNSLDQVRPGDPALDLTFTAMSDSFPVTWLLEQLDRLAKLPEAWEKEVRDGDA